MKHIVHTLFYGCLWMHCFAQQATYTNPVLAGFYPDPSICRAGEDYYMTTSTFSYFPGLPIFHSKDLVNWQQVGHAIDRPGQLDYKGGGVSRGLFAPSIRYHKGVYYIVCTHVTNLGNFVITATDPKGPWSNPVKLPQVNGIDPSLFFDENDKAWIVYNSIPPENKSLYDGHRTIRIYAFDREKLAVTGEEKILVNGGTDIRQKPVWIEAPHIFQKDGWYYLICAEGGTGYNHSEVVFRSRQADGPYIPYENNPILTQRHLDPGRPNPVTTTGHADFVETQTGNWQAVFLACRPYEGDHYNTGRETFMAPVRWKDGWPHILEGKETIKFRYPLPLPQLGTKAETSFSGNFTFSDGFDQDRPGSRWIMLRNPDSTWYSFTEKKGMLALHLRPETISGRQNPSFFGHRQQHMTGEANTLLEFEPRAANEKAGLVIFQNEDHYYFLCQSLREGKPVVELFKGPGKTNAGGSPQLLASAVLPGKISALRLKIRFDKARYAFWYAPRKKKWRLLKDQVDGRFLSTATAGGFVGSVFGLYASSHGEKSTSEALFDFFTYKGNDAVYH